MIRASRRFELSHPYLSVLLYFSNVVIVALLIWGWIALRFSPIQRHYLPAYMECSVGVLSGSELEYVSWIEKKAPGKVREIAQPDDLVPASGEPPFQLSDAARSEGWTYLGFNANGRFQQRDIRNYLDENFFDGHSFWALVLQPFELVLLGFLCWKLFDTWRKDLARERGAAWDPAYRPTSWQEDLPLFLNALYQEAKMAAVRSWRWIRRPRRVGLEPALVTAISVTVSSSQNGEAEPSIPRTLKPNAHSPAAAKGAERVPVGGSGPAASVTNPNPPLPPAVQMVEAESKPKPEPASPFGKPAAEGEPERKWDLSQWIE